MLNEFKLGDLNVIIGANGAGKSNFIQIFRMLMAMTQKNLSKFILERGGADNFLFNGPKVTPKIDMEFEFASLSDNAKGSNSYRLELTPTVFTDTTFGLEEMDAICMMLIVIGESLKNLDRVTEEKLLSRYLVVDWKKAKGMRDIITHHYANINAETVFFTCRKKIPSKILSTVLKRNAIIVLAGFLME